MVNIVVVGGNLTRRPEIRYTPSGTAVSEIRIACNSSYKTQAGEKRETVLFVDAVVWGKTAEACAEYLDKGSKVLVEGELRSREWEDRSGQRHSKVEIQAKAVRFLSHKATNGAAASVAAGAAPAPDPIDGEDVPF